MTIRLVGFWGSRSSGTGKTSKSFLGTLLLNGCFSKIPAVKSIVPYGEGVFGVAEVVIGVVGCGAIFEADDGMGVVGGGIL